MLSANQIKEMIKDGNHEEIKNAFVIWNGDECSVEIQGDGSVSINSEILTDEDLGDWIGFCEGVNKNRKGQ